MRTIILKLHRPGKLKQKILDEAILNYNKAYRFLLNKAFENIAEIEAKFINGKKVYKADALSKWVDKDLSRELNQYQVQPFKDSLKLDFGMTMAGYFKLKEIRPKVSFPKVNALDSSGDELIGDLCIEELRPVYFCRYDTKRSYSLLYDRVSDRYYAKLYLMNLDNARSAGSRKDHPGRLQYIYKDNVILEKGRSKETFLIVPLSFGKYQEKFLKEALEDAKMLRSAKLFKKGKEYYLAVSIDTDQTELIKPETFLGISRGLKNKLNYTIVDLEGQILVSGALTDGKTYKMNSQANSLVMNQNNKETITFGEIHKAANDITALALKFKSQVVLQNLVEKGDKINWTDKDGTTYFPLYKCRFYNQLAKLLEYKLVEKALPKPVKVSSIDIFYNCPECGFNSGLNRFTKDNFLCTKCGSTMEIEKLGSLNLSRKLIKYNCSKIKVKVTKLPDGVKFFNKLIGLDCMIPYTENQPERLREEILRVTEVIRNKIKDSNKNDLGKKSSIMKKFDQSKDLLNLFEFI